MNYYNEIKTEIINNEITKKVKDYSKNRSDLNTYYNVGKLLSEAGKHYGEGIIEEYSKKLVIEVGKKYNKRTLFRMKQFYNVFKNKKVSQLATQLTWSHYIELLPIKDKDKLIYYLNLSIDQRLSRNDLRKRIKNNEYERLDDKTKEKIKENKSNNEVTDNNLKKVTQDKTIGIIICKKDNKFIIEYASDKRILSREYELV